MKNTLGLLQSNHILQQIEIISFIRKRETRSQTIIFHIEIQVLHTSSYILTSKHDITYGKGGKTHISY